MDMRSLHPRTLRLIIETTRDMVMQAQARAEQTRREAIPGYTDAHSPRRSLRTGMLEARNPEIPKRVAEFHPTNAPSDTPSASCKTAFDAVCEKYPHLVGRFWGGRG